MNGQYKDLEYGWSPHALLLIFRGTPPHAPSPGFLFFVFVTIAL